MNSVKLKIFIVLFAVLLSDWGVAKDLPTDTGRVALRSIPASNLNSYKNDDAFNYTEERASGNSIWSRFWRRIAKGIDAVFENKGWSRFFEVLVWILVIGAIVYAVVKYVGMDSVKLFSGNKKAAADLDYLVAQEDIYAIDFVPAIQQAIAQKDFRLAIRLLYLQTLRGLADRDLIHWKVNKTNDVYLRELYGNALHNDFAFLTRGYDYAWYGEFPVTEDQFREIHHRFVQVQKQLP